MPDIVLRSNDGADHKISATTARLSRTVASLLQDLEGIEMQSLLVRGLEKHERTLGERLESFERVSLAHHGIRSVCTTEKGSETVSWGAASKGEDAELLIVPIPNVCNCTLKKVLDFCEQQRAFDDLIRASPAAHQPEVARKTEAWQETYMKVHSHLSVAEAGPR